MRKARGWAIFLQIHVSHNDLRDGHQASAKSGSSSAAAAAPSTQSEVLNRIACIENLQHPPESRLG